jgi:intein/homing endonuclease
MSWEKGNQKPLKPENINEQILALEGYLEDNRAKYWLYKFLKENVTFTTELLTGIELFPFQHMAIKAMMKNDYFLGIWCLDENEYVLTESGFKKIKNISVGEKVRSRNELNTVSDKWTNQKENGLYIQTESGESFKAKLGHKVLAYKDGEFNFKKIQELTKEDYLPIKMSTEQWGDKDITKDSDIKNSPYLFYMLGYVLGDGWINEDGVNYCSESMEIQDAIKNFIEDNGYKSYARQRSDNLFFYEYSIFNRKLVKFIQSLGLDISKKSKEKVIPDSILEAPKNELCALIGGLFDADGYASFQKTNSKVGIKNTALEMLRQVKMLLNNMGIESYLRKSGENNGTPYYDLVLANDHKSLKRFQECIDFIVPHKKENLKKIISRSKTRNYQNKIVPGLGEILKSEGSYKKVIGRRGNWTKNFSQNRFDDIIQLPEDKYKILQAIKNENVVFSKIKVIENCETVSVDITVEGEENYVGNGLVHHNSRGMSKSFTTGIFALLDASLNQGIHTGILSKSFRQSKMIFRKIEDIAQTKKAELFHQCIGKVNKSNDEWSMQIGRSRITALPLGDGEKLRGFRFQRIIVDELLLMPEKIYNEVIMPFLAVVENPTERQKIRVAEDKLIAAGKMKEEERVDWPSNKMIGLSSASYKFEYLYKLYQQYENMIFNPAAKNLGRRCIMQFSYDAAPKALYDENLIAQARGTMSQSQIDREFNAIFTDDSSGYFKISKMADCTILDGESPTVEVIGESGAQYILAFDPSWSEAETSDDFAIQVIKLLPEQKKGVLVHSYALSGANLKKHIEYFKYLMDSFNIVMIVGDYNGGVQFMNSVNESEVFKNAGIKIGNFDADFENPQNYHNAIKEARNAYNLSQKVICHLRKPTSQWIRSANELLQSAFDRKKIYFAAAAMDDSYKRQTRANIPIEKLKFSKYADEYDGEKDVGGKMIDFVEHQKDMIDLTKAECALIQVSSSAGGTQSFDLPSELKRQKGVDKARKDSYSALVLGNWGMSIYYDMMEIKMDHNYAFVPMFIN